MIVRVNKDRNYTVMSNRHLMDKRLSLKAKGLMSVVLALPDDWQYSIAGLASISKEKETSIKTALNELKEYGYFKITKKMPNQTKSGRIEYEWDFYEIPLQSEEKQKVESLTIESLTLENQGQLNTNIPSTKEESTKEIYICDTPKKSTRFIPPTLEEVEEYCFQRQNGIDAKTFYEYYSEGHWKDAKGNPVKNWKQKIITWEKHNKQERKEGIENASNPFTYMLEHWEDYDE